MPLHSSGGGGIQILCLNLSSNIYYITTLLLNQKDLLLKSNRTAEKAPCDCYVKEKQHFLDFFGLFLVNILDIFLPI